MKCLPLIISLLAFVTAMKPGESSAAERFFVMDSNDIRKLSNSLEKMVQEAETDCTAILSGKKPIYAKVPEPQKLKRGILPATNPGTHYRGDGYSISVPFGRSIARDVNAKMVGLVLKPGFKRQSAALTCVWYDSREHPEPGRLVAMKKEELEALPAEVLATFQKAEEDYQAVMAGKKPKHAVPSPANTRKDGTISAYKADGYELTVTKIEAKIGNVKGVIYGPLVRFISTNTRVINYYGSAHRAGCVRFYSKDEFEKLKNK